MTKLGDTFVEWDNWNIQITNKPKEKHEIPVERLTEEIFILEISSLSAANRDQQDLEITRCQLQ